MIARPIGIIAGSGFEQLFPNAMAKHANTPLGNVDFSEIDLGNVRFSIISRHGNARVFPGYSKCPPHRLESKKYIPALYALGVRHIIAFSAVGSVSDKLPVGDIVVPSQFIDLGGSLGVTFCDELAVHVDVTDPFCPMIDDALRCSANDFLPAVKFGGVYACMPGPRFQTAAEANMIKTLGGDVVGQSAVQEVVLATELGLCYSLITVVTNLIGGENKRVAPERIVQTVWSRLDELRTLLKNVGLVLSTVNCSHRTCGEVESALSVASHLFKRPRWALAGK